MRCYKVLHAYRLDGRMEKKEIGIYSTLEKAVSAVESVKDQQGFAERQDGFRIKPCFRLITPKLLDKTFWASGFLTFYD